ncbi:hypothetical protein OPKNFCMD_3025 [Methylobacterium crusticola]|uniref:MarR family transcriptional regulator n=1 Tax=Methylobacterium crusticola TaxID=1697972 RepID=A0ABQ4R088_9HYPH|nr:hypothetical protein [Methylobacterium crusticola]GJD50286.1 hypothetical protein OPKNFCMD_3025 [Methylobacterium crusticola]
MPKQEALSPTMRAECARAGRVLLDRALGRLGREDREAFWSAVDSLYAPPRPADGSAPAAAARR